MTTWTSSETPEEILTRINVVDIEIKTILNSEINGSYITARKMAEAAMTNEHVSLRSSSIVNPADNTPISIWKALTTTSNLFLTAQGAKLVWTEAIKYCTEPRFLAAAEDVKRRQFADSPNLGTSDLDTYEEELQRISFGGHQLDIPAAGRSQRPRRGVVTAE